MEDGIRNYYKNIIKENIVKEYYLAYGKRVMIGNGEWVDREDFVAYLLLEAYEVIGKEFKDDSSVYIKVGCGYVEFIKIGE